MTVAHLSNKQLIAGLTAVLGDSRACLARLLVYLGEVDERRLHLEMACPSLFDFCVRRLGMSEDEACRRIKAARVVRRFPVVLAMVETGELGLSGIGVLATHLTPENHEELLRAAGGRTKREIQELVADREPRAPVPARVDPLGNGRYKLQFTASAELLAKIERARDLMMHRNPSGDLVAVIEAAVDALTMKLEKERSPKKRAAIARDGERCVYVDEEGHRCPATALLELDHRDPRARGGGDKLDNLRVFCRAHNYWWAIKSFGREKVDQEILRQRAATALSKMGLDPHDIKRAIAEAQGTTLDELIRAALAIIG